MANACIFHPFTLVAAPSDCELDQSMANTCTFRSFMDVGVLRVGGGGEDNMENTFVVQPTLSAVKSTCGHERDQWACCEWGAKLETTVLIVNWIRGKHIRGTADPLCCQEHLWSRA
jgi:hypothetical protein